MKETQNGMGYLLSAVDYQEHKWVICGDLKVVRPAQVLQGGCRNYPYFLCL